MMQPIPWQRHCSQPSFDAVMRACDEPVAGAFARDGRRYRGCRDHILVAERHGLAATHQCSVCLRPADQGYQLDASGRCVRCQP